VWFVMCVSVCVCVCVYVSFVMCVYVCVCVREGKEGQIFGVDVDFCEGVCAQLQVYVRSEAWMFSCSIGSEVMVETRDLMLTSNR